MSDNKEALTLASLTPGLTKHGSHCGGHSHMEPKHTHTALIIHSFRAIHNKTWDLLQSNLTNADMSRYIQLAYVCHSIGAKRKTMELVTF